MDKYRKPARSYEDFKKNFQYYADIAYGIQQEVERAILYIVKCRLEAYPAENLCYSGGTALNAVANARILSATGIKQIYIEPAAGDNGLSLGCAYYGWLEVLKKERRRHNGSTCFGISYSAERIQKDIDTYQRSTDPLIMRRVVDEFFAHLNRDKTAVPQAKASIQFEIGDLGVFQVLIDGGIRSVRQALARPTCMVSASEDDFYRILTQPGTADEMMRSGKIKVSNSGELDQLLRNINLEKFSRLAKELVDNESFEYEKSIQYTVSEDYIRHTAELLAQGKIIGWFQDGCEFGPRALGRRSILADPRNKGVRDFINTHIKFREDFRPFAPSVLREDVSLYFRSDMDSPYMILVDPVRDEWLDRISSVVHKNRTSRIQTVTPEWNGKFHRLLKEFKKISGISVLLNTSFNRKGMPIVETPGDAIDFFFSCKLDYLVMDKYIIGKEQAAVLPVEAYDLTIGMK